MIDTMIKDPYESKTLIEMKAIHSLYMAFIEYPNIRIDVKVTDNTPSASINVQEIKRTYGNHSWTDRQETTVLHVNTDWFEKVFLNGIATVYYNNKLNAVIGAIEDDVKKLRSDLQLPGTKLFKCLVPIITAPYYNYHNGGWQSGSVTTEKRYIVAQYTESGDVFSNAGLSPNRAGANLKRKMMDEMRRKMNL